MELFHICLSLILCRSFSVLFLHLEEPRSVVFDEVHYGSICQLYHRGEFHVDEQPPAAKMFLCAMFPHRQDGDKIWREIGTPFPSDFPLWRIRIFPALFGFLLPLLAYCIVIRLGFSQFSALVAAFLVAFDNSLTVQSKFFLPDSLILFLQFLSLYFALGSSSMSYRFAGVTVGIAIASHSSSVVTWILVASLCLLKAWNSFTDPRIPFIRATLLASVQLYFGLVAPFLVYYLIFVLHLAILPNSGPHNFKLSSAFQASLNQGPEIPLRPVTFGSFVTLRSVSKGCFLTSTSKIYPAVYEDGRGSSRQQLVSCVNHRGPHNWWLVTPPNDQAMSRNSDNKIHNGAEIQLVHSRTMNKLQTTYVRAPISLERHEVSCYLGHTELDIMPNWTLRLVNVRDDLFWHSIRDHVQLFHNKTKSILSVTHEKLPTGDLEVVSDQIRTNWLYEESEWIVEDIFTNRQNSTMKGQSSGLIDFLGKLIEIHKLMWTMSRSSDEHRFSSTPLMWPLAQSTIIYWHNSTTGAQIHFVGNPLSWISGLLAMIVQGIVIITWSAMRQRQYGSVGPEIWERNAFAHILLGSGWVLHMVWLTASDRPMFVYLYLYPLLYKHILHGCVAGTLCDICGRIGVVCYFILMVAIANTYESLLPLTLGQPLVNSTSFNDLQWWDSWEFLTTS